MNKPVVAQRRPGAVLVGLALLFGVPMLAAPVGAAPSVASRTEQVSAREPVTALELVGENGEVRVVAGPRFSATIEFKVEAETQAAADFLLARTRVSFAQPPEKDGKSGGKVTLTTSKPSRDELAGNGRHTIETRYQVTLPATASLTASTTNGNIAIEGVSGPQRLETVNGRVAVIGAAHSLALKSVNGNVEGTLAEVAGDAQISAETVNGSVILWVPAKARLRLEASSVNGEVVSTLALPVQKQAASLGPPNRRYQGATEPAGPTVRMTSVNGRIALLASGTRPRNARPLVVSAPGLQPVPAQTRGPTTVTEGTTRTGAGAGQAIRRGLVAGDFLVEDAAADVHADAISGAAKVRSLAGDVHLGTVGGKAEIETAGGDIRLTSVKGDLQARTGGGDVRVDEIGGIARVDSQGGNIQVGGCSDIVAITAGGDVSLQRVRGSVRAQTAGGAITVEVVSKAPAAGIDLGSNGGDVTLTLPANFRGDVTVETRMGEGLAPRAAGRAIISDFAELTTSVVGGVHSASGKLGGGGPKIVIRTVGGVVKLRKGPAL